MHLNYRNVNSALPDLVDVVLEQGVLMGSRNGEVLTVPNPITVTTINPWERVCLNPKRKSNPFLFLLDGLSTLSHVDLVAPLAKIVPRMVDFSDDGVTLRGHYGSRLYDLIPTAIEMLAKDEFTRRCVMSIWDNSEDLDADSKDIPCNIMVIPRVVDRARDYKNTAKELDLTVVNRSNDLFWGMMGANVVQFSFVQEFMAKALGIGVGHLSQMSTNLHFYTGFGPGQKVEIKTPRKNSVNPFFWTPGIYPPHVPIDFGVGGFRTFQNEVNDIMIWRADKGPEPEPSSFFLASVVIPMMRAWDKKSAVDLVGDTDWFVAARAHFKEG